MKGYCNGGKKGYFSSIRDPRKQRFARLPCENWGCPICGPNKFMKFGLHFAERFLLTNGSLIVRSDKTRANWDAFRQEWRRRKKEGYGPVSWVKVDRAGGEPVVIECHPDPFGEAMPGEVLADRKEAIRRLGEALREAAVELVRVGTRNKPLAKKWFQNCGVGARVRVPARNRPCPL